MITRAKFKCQTVTIHESAKDVEFTPVTSSDKNNEGFWKFTPSGILKLTWINDKVDFKPGRDYYVDITEVTPQPEVQG